MAVIVFYEATKIDRVQLAEGLRQTDHQWEFCDDTLSVENVNADAEVISVFVTSTVTRQLINKMPRLKLIATRSTGFDHIDVGAAMERGITVVNVPSYGENTVAEHAFALLLAVTRRLVPTIEATIDGTFRASDHTGIDLKGRTLGIVGMGHIGQHAARMARGFEMNVIAFDVFQNEELARDLGFTYASFEDVLTSSDVLTLHTPLTPNNFHLINHSTIARMKPGAIIINTARGELVENRALLSALRSGHLGGAGLDTLEGEQFLRATTMLAAIDSNATSPTALEHAVEVHALMQMPNVVVTQHVAFNTAEAIERINSTTTQNIISFWYGDTPNKVQQRHDIGKLVIVRHGESDWNAQGLWTGSTDVHLSTHGLEQAVEYGHKLRDIHFEYAFTSQQIRTRETLESIKNGSEQLDLHSEANHALNERDYGVYTGMSKDKIHEAIGDEAFNELRRSWDSPVEGGESLRDVYERVIPFYLRIILPRLRHGQNVLVVAHGNSIRSLIKYIENISDDAIGDVEMVQDTILVYDVDNEGRNGGKTEIPV